MKKLIFTILILFIATTANPQTAGVVFLGNTDYTQDADCKLAYTMNVDESPIQDQSTNNKDGTLKGAGEPNYTASGKYGGAYDWDGADDYVSVGTNLNNLSAISVVCWFYADSLGESSKGYFVDKGNALQTGWTWNINGDTKFTFQRYHDNAASDSIFRTTDTGVFATGAWYHLAVTWDGGKDASEDIKIYVNGSEVTYSAEQDAVGSPDDDSGRTMYIGYRSDGARTFEGRIDELAIFERVLSEVEINEIMNNSLEGGQ